MNPRKPVLTHNSSTRTLLLVVVMVLSMFTNVAASCIPFLVSAIVVWKFNSFNAVSHPETFSKIPLDLACCNDIQVRIGQETYHYPSFKQVVQTVP